MKNIVIVGGGIIGLCSSYYLMKNGHKVTLIDNSDFMDGCSYGNAGMIVPSHIVPLAQPGMIAKGMKWMFNSKSPFYVKPILSRSLLSWGLKFYKSATKEHVQKSARPLLDLSLLSKKLYHEFSELSKDFLYEEKGLLMLFQNTHLMDEIIDEARYAEEFGLKVDYFNEEEIKSIETTRLNAIGGVLYKSDAHLYPQKFIQFLLSELENKVTILKNTNVIDFEFENSKITKVITKSSAIDCDECVISAGSWSPFLLKKLNLNIDILPGKGYSFTLKNVEKNLNYPAILCDGKVAVTPMGNDLRFGGTMEITNIKSNEINMSRVTGIVETVKSFYPDLKFDFPKKEDIWYGFRPCTPTGLPIISRTKKYSNLVIATGHSMMGLSLATGTGKVVSELIDHSSTSVAIDTFKLKE